jgi:hypothetical protein
VKVARTLSVQALHQPGSGCLLVGMTLRALRRRPRALGRVPQRLRPAPQRLRNQFEQALIEPVLRVLADPARHGLGAEDGLGIVVPHRAERAALQQSFPELCVIDPTSGLPVRSAIDTVPIML